MSDDAAFPHRWRLWPILFGIAVAVTVYWLLGGREGLSPQGRTVAAVGSLMAAWWMTEALPLAVTGLLPLALFPLLGAVSMNQAAAPYAQKIIFLFLGGMLLGRTMERWDLHKRFALAAIALLGAGPNRLIGVFLGATAFMSMWVSNTAATIMMLPIGAMVAAWLQPRVASGEESGATLAAESERNDFGPAVVLAIAFGASIGGVGSLIGTPPIAQFAGFANKMADAGGTGLSKVTFFTWLRLGLPTLLLVLPVTWFILTRVAFRMPRGPTTDIRPQVREELRVMGPISGPQWLTIAVFGTAAVLWILAHWLEIDDAAIAIAAAIALFVLPVKDGAGGHRPLLTWTEAERIPWGILLLFGGGLSLAEAINQTGVDQFIARGADGLTGVPLLPLLWIVALVTIILTEFTSNTALVAAGLPVADAIASRLGVPVGAVLVTMTLTASLGFMLPAGTAPNALVFASGRVTMRQMMRAGIWLDVACAAAVPLLVLGAMKLGVLPGT